MISRSVLSNVVIRCPDSVHLPSRNSNVFDRFFGHRGGGGGDGRVGEGQQQQWLFL